MKKQFLSFASWAFLGIFSSLGFVAVASASGDEPVSVCYGCDNGNYGNRTFTLDAGANHFGSGKTQALGNRESFAKIEKSGGADAGVNLTGVTNGCEVGCGAFKGNLNALAFETLRMQSGALSTGTNGVPAVVSIDNFGVVGASAYGTMPTQYRHSRPMNWAQ